VVLRTLQVISRDGRSSIRDYEPWLERLLALPLFQGIGADTRNLCRFEARLAADPTQVPEGAPAREGYLGFIQCVPETTIVAQGELSTSFFVVLDGIAHAAHASARSGSELLEYFQRGDWFGEASALSNCPALTTVRAEAPLVLAVFDQRLFTRLRLDLAGSVFTESIDRRYRERYLPLHLRVAPLFAGLGADPERLQRVTRNAAIVPAEKGKEIAVQGAKADAFYLVLSGAIAAVRASADGGRRIVAYYRANSTFGEHTVATEDDVWPTSIEALTASEVVRIPRASFDELRAADPLIHRALTRRANLIVGERNLDELYARPRGLDDKERLADDELEVMVHRGSVKGGNALVIDKTRCIRCNACVESCAAVHGDGVPRLSKVGTRISTYEVLITACYNCEVPECMAQCEFGAIRRDAQGMVRFVYDNCVGCTYCTKGCPYGVIRMIEPAREDAAARRPGFFESLLAGLPVLGRVFARPSPPAAAPWSVASVGGEAVAVGGKSIKCDSCAGLPFEACVYNCPTSAIERRPPESLFRV
jgi:CRP-like cAMP-binding protein/Fe-S-cluster-containing hydrogenase component 2